MREWVTLTEFSRLVHRSKDAVRAAAKSAGIYLPAPGPGRRDPVLSARMCERLEAALEAENAREFAKESRERVGSSFLEELAALEAMGVIGPEAEARRRARGGRKKRTAEPRRHGGTEGALRESQRALRVKRRGHRGGVTNGF